MAERRSIVIAGGGVVALYAAARLGRELDAETELTLVLPQSADARPKANRDLFINANHWRRLAELGVELPAAEATVNRIKLAMAGVAETIEFAGEDLGIDSRLGFGAVANADELRASLLAAIERAGRVRLCQTDADSLKVFEDNNRRWAIEADSLGQRQPDLLLVADKGLVPEAASQADRCGHVSGDFGQTALSGIVETGHSLGHCAWQLFLPSGPLAMLPLPQPGLASFIWTLDDDIAAKAAKCDREILAEELQERLAARFGRISLKEIYPPAPLRWRRHQRLYYGRLALLGDAARIVHPMAGIGANLGFHGADLLAEGLGDGKGIPVALRRWQRESDCHAHFIHLLLSAIRQLSPLLGQENPFSPAAGKAGSLLANTLAKSRGLRRWIVATAMVSGSRA